MRRFVLAAGLTAALLTLSACSGPAPGTAPPSGSETPATATATGLPEPASNTALNAAFVPLLEAAGMPAGSLYVVNSDGTHAATTWNGSTTGATVSAESVFAYRSITKSFIGTVILQLADEGVLSLTDPISQYVPGVPGGDLITIDDLGRMRSGLANYSALPAMSEALATRLDAPPSTETLLDWAFAASPDFAPGTRYEYSNTNTLLLGKVIESVTGTPWYDSVTARMLDPLDLSTINDGFTGGDHDAAGFNVTADADPEPVPVVPAAWFGAAGALTGSASDLAKWGEALGSGSMVSVKTQLARIESLAPTDDDTASPAYDRYGFALGEISGWLGHTGNGLGFQSLVMYEPATKRTVVVLVNGTGSDGDVPARIFKQLLPVINGESD